MRQTKRYLAMLVAVLMMVPLALSASAAAVDLIADIIDAVKDDNMTVAVYDNTTIDANSLTAIQAKLGTNTDVIYAVPSGAATGVKREAATYKNPAGTTANVPLSSFELRVNNNTDDVVAMTPRWRLAVEDNVLVGWNSKTNAQQAAVLDSLGVGIVWENEAARSIVLVGSAGVPHFYSWKELLDAGVVTVAADDALYISIHVAKYDGTGAPAIAGKFVLLPDGVKNDIIYDPLWLVTGLKSTASGDSDWVTIYPPDAGGSKENPKTGR